MWDDLGCSRDRNGFAPIVEQDFGPGTAHAHFDEGCMDLELMSGLVDDGMTLSKFTVATLEDLGYDVNYKEAEDMDVPDCCRGRSLREEKTQTGRGTRRRLTKENRDAARKFGKLELKRFKELKKNLDGDSELQELLQLNNVLLKVATTVTVFVEQDGHIIDMDVVGDDDDDDDGNGEDGNDVEDHNIFDHEKGEDF